MRTDAARSLTTAETRPLDARGHQGEVDERWPKPVLSGFNASQSYEHGELVGRTIIATVGQSSSASHTLSKYSLRFHANTCTRWRPMQGCQREHDHERSSTWIAKQSSGERKPLQGLNTNSPLNTRTGAPIETREALGTAVQ